MAPIIKISKEEAQRRLSDVSGDRVFWCCDGSTIRSMRELEKALKKMRDETFSTHSNDEKKDFSNWVNDVIGDDKLARDLAKAKDKQQAAKCVSARIEFLSSKLA